MNDLTYEEVAEIFNEQVAHIPGYFKLGDAWVIYQLSKQLPEDAVIVEVGSLFGKSAYVWSLFLGPKSTIYCIDNCKADSEKHNYTQLLARGFTEDDLFPQQEIFKRHTSKFNNIHFIEAWSPNLDWDKEIDLVFIDASHSDKDVLIDNIYFWDSHLKDDGLLTGHDFKIYNTGNDHTRPGIKYDVIECVKAYANDRNAQISLYGNSSFWSIKKGVG